MKMSKKALFSLLAVSGLGLTAILPSGAALAGTGSASLGDDGTTLVTGDVNGILNSTQSVGIGNTDFFIANKAANGSEGTATADSDAHTQIISDILTLEAVPDLGFGSIAPGTKRQLNDNSSALNNDGNGTGLISVSDSRTRAAVAPAAATEGLGYKLSATLGPVARYTSSAYTEKSADAAIAGFKLSLTPSKVTDGAGKVRADVTLGTGIMTSVETGQSNSVTVLSSTEGKGYGQTNVSVSGKDDAMLETPETATKGYYAGTITWTLDAAAPTA